MKRSQTFQTDKSCCGVFQRDVKNSSIIYYGVLSCVRMEVEPLPHWSLSVGKISHGANCQQSNGTDCMWLSWHPHALQAACCQF